MPVLRWYCRVKAVLFTGSRGWKDVDMIYDTIDGEQKPFLGIVGDADGWDLFVWEALADFHLPRFKFKARWRSEGYYNRGAGHDRNRLMVQWLVRLRAKGWQCSVIAGWDGQSRGTKGCIAEAQRSGFDVRRVMYVKSINEGG